MAERYIKIYMAALGTGNVSHIDPPLTEEEKKEFEEYKEWANDIRAQANKEGRTIEFEIPFD